MAKSKGRDKEREKAPKKRRREKEDSSPSPGRQKKHRKSNKDSKSSKSRKSSSKEKEKDSRKKSVSSSSKDKKRSNERREGGGKGETAKHGVKGAVDCGFSNFKIPRPPYLQPVAARWDQPTLLRASRVLCSDVIAITIPEIATKSSTKTLHIYTKQLPALNHTYFVFFGAHGTLKSRRGYLLVQPRLLLD